MPINKSAIRVQISRLGWHFVFIGAFAMVGGAIRGFNLPLVLAGLIVGALLMHWRLGRRTMEAIEIRRRLPDEAFAGEPFNVRFLVTNHSAWTPAWLIRVDDRIQAPAEATGAGLRTRGLALLLSKVSNATEPLEVAASCGVGFVGSGRTVVASYECLAAHRGKYRFGPSGASTGVPLGLIFLRRFTGDEQSMYVFPRLLGLRRDWRRRLQSRSGGMSTTARRSGASDGDFFGLRSWQQGDSQRWIHWRTTARIGEPAVRQFEQQRKFDLCILVDAYTPAVSDADREEFEQRRAIDDVETVVSAAATLLTSIVATPTNRVALAIAGARNEVIANAGTRDQLTAMLKILADAEPTPNPDLVEVIDRVFHSLGKPQDLVVVSPRLVPASGEKIMALLKGRCAVRWYSTLDGSIDLLIERSRTHSKDVS